MLFCEIFIRVENGKGANYLLKRKSFDRNPNLSQYKLSKLIVLPEKVQLFLIYG